MVIVIGVIFESVLLVILVVRVCVPFELPGSSVPEMFCPEHRRWSGVSPVLPVSVLVLSNSWDSTTAACTGVGCSEFPWSVCDV